MTHRPWRAVIEDCRGVSALEFAVLLPLFLSLIIGLMQFGQVMWTQSALQHAVEMAARCASINTAACGSAAQIRDYAVTQAYGLTIPAATFTPSTVACGNQVLASFPFTLDIPLLPLPALTLSARSCYPA
jgi:Flp pilus assembly protein TadG